jgi:hypothetical protein
MKFTKKSDVVVMKLDSDDLVPLMARVVRKVLTSDTIMKKMLDWETHMEYPYYVDMMKELGLDEVEVLKGFHEASALSDELTTVLFDLVQENYENFDLTKPVKKEAHLKLVKICVECHKGFVKGEQHDCL